MLGVPAGAPAFERDVSERLPERRGDPRVVLDIVDQCVGVFVEEVAKRADADCKAIIARRCGVV